MRDKINKIEIEIKRLERNIIINGPMLNIDRIQNHKLKVAKFNRAKLALLNANGMRQQLHSREIVIDPFRSSSCEV
jgi:hypothetical protein